MGQWLKGIGGYTVPQISACHDISTIRVRIVADRRPPRQLPFGYDRLRDRLHARLRDVDRRDAQPRALAGARVHVHLHNRGEHHPARARRAAGRALLRVVPLWRELRGAGDDVRVGEPDLRGRPRSAGDRARVDEHVEQRGERVVAARVLSGDGRAVVHEGDVGDDRDERRDAGRDVVCVVYGAEGVAAEGEGEREREERERGQ